MGCSLDWKCNGLSELRIDSDGRMVCCCDYVGKVNELYSIFDLDDPTNLEKFICDENLKKLEKIFGQFNIFDCLKLTRAEIRHSNFLAWLLNPNETH